MTQSTTRIGTVLAFCVLSLWGCASTETTFQPPQVDVPQHWSHALPITADNTPWWQTFQDPELNRLVERVLKSNNDLASATLALQKARLEAGLAEDDLNPELASSTTASKQKNLSSGTTTDSFSTSLSVSYEVDLWGKLSADADAYVWAAKASEEDRESVAQSLIATTASLYWQVGYLSELVSLNEQNIQAAQTTLALTEKQYQYGSVSQLDVIEARRTLASLQASQTSDQQDLTEAKNALALLFNQAPTPDTTAISRLPQGPLPEIDAGIPAELLQRRPDVRSALATLRSEIASQQATEASYFPSLTLTGTLGTSSSALEDLLRNPIGTLGAGLTLPFLQWNEMKIQEQIADINVKSAIIDYRQTLYSAFQDVENALSARQQYQAQNTYLTTQYQAALAAEKIYQSRYQYGSASLIDWLDAQEDRRSVEADLLENRYNQFQTLATLYQALGDAPLAASTIQK